jgi:beta-mannanase
VAGASNIKWIFSINWEDIPKEKNSYLSYYPGDGFVDYVGIDGYNWGDTQPWSKWMSFSEIFKNRYDEVNKLLNKPVLVTEFSSVSSGGDKALWIREALSSIKKMKKIKGFVLFNIDKEGDWGFKEGNPSGRALKKSLIDSYFQDTWYNKTNG